MTNEEVLKLIEDGRIIPIQIKANDEETSKYNLKNLEALNMIIKALQKDIPMPPKRDKIPRCGMGERYYDWICPTCGTFLAYEPNVEGIPNRCQTCGQLIYKGAEE